MPPLIVLATKNISIHALREEGDNPGTNIADPLGYFYPRPPRGGRLDGILADTVSVKFLSTPSARRATPQGVLQRAGHSISIHALREEGDVRVILPPFYNPNFYPRPPRGGRRHPDASGADSKNISIHALREEGDAIDAATLTLKAQNFYPRPPRGGRLFAAVVNKIAKKFLSTPSARRATNMGLELVRAIDISIHALREEGDRCTTYQYCMAWLEFLSTPSARRATDQDSRPTRGRRHFYPRPPRGGRQAVVYKLCA